MITLITAVPGSGKTLSVIDLIIKAVTDGRMVFTNIDGLRKDILDPSGKFLHDAPDDWRDTPHGSLVFYDECQQPHLYPSNAKPGLVTDERLTAMETHRHSGHDLVFMTQAPTLVHHHIRKLVGQHIHLYRGKGISGAMRYEWSHTCDNPNDRNEQQRSDSAFWKFPKKYYGLYKSATVHTHKFKMPKKLWWLIFLLVGVSLFLLNNLNKNKGLSILNASADELSNVSPLPPPHGVANGSEARATVGGDDLISQSVQSSGLHDLSTNINYYLEYEKREVLQTSKDIKRAPFLNYRFTVDASIMSKDKIFLIFNLVDEKRGVSLKQTNHDLTKLGYSIEYISPCVVVLDHKFEHNAFYVTCEKQGSTIHSADTESQA